VVRPEVSTGRGVSAIGSAGARGGSGGAAVLVNESAQNVQAFDVAVGVDLVAWDRHVEVDASVGAGRVVVRQVRGEDPVQVAVVADQDPVQAFGPNGAHPTFGVGVRPG